MKREPTMTKRQRKAAAWKAKESWHSYDIERELEEIHKPKSTRVPASAVYGNRFERGGWVLRFGTALRLFAITKRCL